LRIYLAGKEYKGLREREKFDLGLRNRLSSFYQLEFLRLSEDLFNENILSRYNAEGGFKLSKNK